MSGLGVIGGVPFTIDHIKEMDMPVSLVGRSWAMAAVVGVSSFAAAVPAAAAVTSVSIATAGTKTVGATTYAWGTVSGGAGVKACTQVLLGSRWSTSQCTTTTSATGSYAIPLTYGSTTPGTYTFRVLAEGAVSPSATLTRTAATPAPSGTPAWAGYSTTYLRNSAGAALSKIPVNTKVYGKIFSSSLFQITSGPASGKYIRNYDLFWSDPATYGPTAPGTTVAPPGQTVTRYVMTNKDPIAVRSGATTHSTLMTYVANGAAPTGHYVNSDWFKITSGANTGRYVSAGLVYTTKTMGDYNGVAKKTDMCALPSWAATAWGPTVKRYLSCPAAKSFVEMNAAFRAQYGYDIKVEEAYRDLKMQQMYIQFLGYPRAAMPGTSNHGMGNAVDLESTDSARMAGTTYHSGFGGTYEQWINAHGKEYGWDRPAYLDPTGNNPESWHYNFIG